MAETKNIEFNWGKKRGLGGRRRNVQFYESFTYDGLHYTLYDNVYLHEEGQPSPYIGKLIKIWENPDKSRRVKVLWYFQPREILNHIEVELIHPKEVFLGSGEGLGLANVNALEALGGKCNVVCISKDSRNPQPSDQDIQMADFVFRRTFNVNRCIIMDKMDDTIAGVDVKFIFNRMDSLKSSSIHNCDAGDKHGGETALETNERVISSGKLNSSENENLEDGKGETKPVFGEKLAADKIVSSLEVKENKDLKVDELDERPHKKVKLESSGKVSDDENYNDVRMPNCDSDRYDSKPLVPEIIASEDEPRCAPNESPPRPPPDDGIVTVDKAMEVTTTRPDIISGVLELSPSFLSFCFSLATWSSTNNAH